ncbi:putative signal transducing protein [Luteibacter sp.]|uniref:putative signal transducing protein n=1 Tax=Luteibacter sp. TaxID=1886636 RepID=UPI003F7F3ECF
MRIVYHAQSLIDAHLVRDALAQAEIPAFISGEYLTGAIGELPALGLVAVMVPDAAAEAADGIVRAVDARLVEARAAAAEGDFDAGILPA